LLERKTVISHSAKQNGELILGGDSQIPSTKLQKKPGHGDHDITCWKDLWQKKVSPESERRRRLKRKPSEDASSVKMTRLARPRKEIFADKKWVN